MRNIWGTQEQQIDSARKHRKATITRFKRVPLIVAIYDINTPRGTRYGLQAWVRKAAKPQLNYWFRTSEQREKYVADYAKQLEHHEAARRERNAKSRQSENAADHFSVGDVIYNSWGYDQTNIDFYQVTEVKRRSIIIRSLKRNTNDHGGPSGGKCAPRRFEFCGEPIKKIVKAGGHIAFDHGCGSKWTGKALYCSSYH